MMEQILSSLSTDQLVARFTEIALAQHNALIGGEIRLFNRLFKKMTAIESELQSRPGDQRSALLSLLDHADIGVRWKASTATLAVAPQAARRTLEAVAKSGEMPIAGHAGMNLRFFDARSSKPA